MLKDINVELKYLKDIANEDMPLYFNAADLVLLTSLYEGSPNVIKESMACNRPILSTNVGDVAHLFNNVEGCNLVSFEKKDVANRIRLSLKNVSSSNGREKVKQLAIDSESVAQKLINIYKEIIYEK